MSKKIGKLAISGVMTALALVFLLLTTSPLSTVALAALAALCGLPVVIEAGKRAALVHYAAVALLALLLVPTPEGKGLYIAFFGWYTVFKAWVEGKRFPRPAEWSVKLGAAAITMAAVLAGMRWLWHLPLPVTGWPLAGALVGLCGVFLLYDWGLTGLVSVYATRLHPALSRLFRL